MLAPENAFENVVRWPLCFGLNVLMSRQSICLLADKIEAVFIERELATGQSDKRPQ